MSVATIDEVVKLGKLSNVLEVTVVLAKEVVSDTLPPLVYADAPEATP